MYPDHLGPYGYQYKDGIMTQFSAHVRKIRWGHRGHFLAVTVISTGAMTEENPPFLRTGSLYRCLPPTRTLPFDYRLPG